jgi:hypothetical protein
MLTSLYHCHEGDSNILKDLTYHSLEPSTDVCVGVSQTAGGVVNRTCRRCLSHLSTLSVIFSDVVYYDFWRCL